MEIDFTPINFSEDLGEFKSSLKQFFSNSPSPKIALLCDTNTLENCYTKIADLSFLKEAEIIEVEPGEASKNIEIANHIWENLLELDFTKADIIINLGGGMICDLGGFVASTFKRGMRFIHIPTTYLAMVDASIGGKQGINLLNAKNQVGVINAQEATFICPDFLDTLPQREINSGLAETIKHGLIGNPEIWQKAEENLTNLIGLDLIKKSIEVKQHIVNLDPYEKGERKKLNFGHTIGHALENVDGNGLLHGEAVAHGMLVEAFISMERGFITELDFNKIKALINSNYGKPSLEIESTLKLITKDKKNMSDKINFTLLNSIGKASFDNQLDLDEVKELLENFNRLA